MRSSYQRLWRRLATCSLSLATAGFAASCQQLGEPSASGEASRLEMQAGDSSKVAVTQQAQADDSTCGFGCPAEGILKGNASISGVPSVDAFFQSLVDFRTKASGVSAEIDAQLAAIRADFDLGVDADLATAIKAQIRVHAASLKIEAEPARCVVNAEATLQAQARCDVSVDPGKVSAECKGSCEVEATADVSCDASAELKCTVVAPSVECEGQCKGSCDVEVSGGVQCSGTCSGECDGTCSAYAMREGGEASCAGTCSGMCKGRCKTEFAAEAKCEGSCEGECTVTKPSGGCEGGIRAECTAKADAMITCEGRCRGEFVPPKASAECEANARAQAKLNVDCTPPRLAIHYSLKADAGLAGLDLRARLRFVAALKNLEVRLPALLAAIERAKAVAEAAEELRGKGRDAIEAAAMAGGGADASLRVRFGLGCALKQVPAIRTLLEDSGQQLAASIMASADLKSGLEL